ncbi:MAG: hypothetical protein JWP12_911 [Bacteroidetes bacterium]|nr:hypothetical protein [Bacteroidota bacterium]
MMLQQTFITLAQRYSSDDHLINALWEEIEKNYSGKKRHYHTLAHLDNLISQLNEVKAQIRDWDTVLFSVFYHDVIYSASAKDNEEKSAALAEKRLTSLSFPADKIKNCTAQILATKAHTQSNDNDINLFTDADLSVLGQSREVYTDYFKNVRKEYSIYPDFLYNPGRKKVVQHFLNMERIFKTDFFFYKMETQARENLAYELKVLS